MAIPFLSPINALANIRLANSGKLFLWNDHDSNYLMYDEWRAYASSGMTIQNAAPTGSIFFQTNSTTALTLDSSQNATFAGALTTAGIITVNGGTENLLGSFVSTDSIAEIRIQDNTAYTRLLNVGSQFKIMPNDGSETLILDGNDDSATFAGNVNVNGIQITVGNNNSIFAENTFFSSL